MVLQVLSNAGDVCYDIDPEGGEFCCVAHAGQLQYLGTPDGAGTQNHLSGAHPMDLSPSGVFDSDGLGPLEQHLVGECARDDVEVGTLLDRVEIGARCG